MSMPVRSTSNAAGRCVLLPMLSGRVRVLSGLGLGERNELGQRFYRRVLADHQHKRHQFIRPMPANSLTGS